jgi:phage terminase large subunit-like protein
MGTAATLPNRWMGRCSGTKSILFSKWCAASFHSRYSSAGSWTSKQRYGSSTLLIEDSPISRGLIQSLKEQSINVTTYKPDTDKRARVIAQTDLFAGGSVRFSRRAAWLEEFTAELLAFPGRHDDQVDVLTQGLAWGRVRRSGFSVGTVMGMH